MNSSNASFSNFTNSSVSNVSVADEKFTEEYVVFNYIMVGVSCSLLLIVIIIAKLLCIFNRNADYDNLNSSPVMSGEKAIFHTEDLQNVSEEIKRSSPVTDSIVSRRYPTSACPRSANSTSAYYHDVPSVKGVWHTDENHSIEQGVDDYFITNSDKQRLSLDIDPDPADPKCFRIKCPLSLYSQSAPIGNQFLDLDSSQHRLPMCKWSAPTTATTVNASAPNCSLLLTHCESET